MFTAGGDESGYIPENNTQAEGVWVRFPLRSGVVIAEVKESDGIFVAVGEEDILPEREALARLGFYIELTSAIAWPALAQTIRDLADPIVLVLTGSSLKSV